MADNKPSQGARQSLILKLITPPPMARADDEGHVRKVLSYQVEQYFYTQLAPQLPSSLPVATCLATSISNHDHDGTATTAMILSDLKTKYPVAGEKYHVLSSMQIHSALDWLAGFHGFWWSRWRDFDVSLLVQPPLEEARRNASEKTVWLNGGYTYLATRRKEYADLAAEESEWSTTLTSPVEGLDQSVAELVAQFLAPTASGYSPTSPYQTLIHGDVKSENLFTSTSGDQVAFYDFQYVGLGLGVCDLAKLFTCSVPLAMLVNDKSIPEELQMQEGERALLERYWLRLKHVGDRPYSWDTFVLHWEAALVDWLRFQASWGFWGNTEWLQARGRSILKDPGWRNAVISATTSIVLDLLAKWLSIGHDILDQANNLTEYMLQTLTQLGSKAVNRGRVSWRPGGNWYRRAANNTQAFNKTATSPLPDSVVAASGTPMSSGAPISSGAPSSGAPVSTAGAMSTVRIALLLAVALALVMS
ncbi:hypothetical protein ACEQ8H_005440 [Pleosporales sp. CAS-2024a]